MRKLTEEYRENIETVDAILRVKENFDLLKKTLRIGEDEVTLYYIDGFVKDAVMQKLMLYLVSLKGTGDDAHLFMEGHLPYVETDVSDDLDFLFQMVLSGAAILFGSRFGTRGIVIDARTLSRRARRQSRKGTRLCAGHGTVLWKP